MTEEVKYCPLDIINVVEEGQLDKLRELLSRGLCLSFGDLLHRATKHHRANIIPFLLNHGCDVNAKDDQGKTALQYSVEENNYEITIQLLWNRAKFPDDVNLLSIAAQRQFVNIVKILLDFGAAVNARDSYGQTALHLCVLQNRNLHLQSQDTDRDLKAIENIARKLLARGADVNALTHNGFSPLHFAVVFGYSDVVLLLLKFGADVHMKISEYVTHPETGECFCMIENLCFLLESRSHKAFKGDKPWKIPLSTILHVAVKWDHADIVRMLLGKGANPNAIQDDGKSVLAVAAANSSGSNCEEIIKTLVQYNSLVNFKDTKYEKTPLHLATAKNNKIAVEALLRNGAKVDEQDGSKDTALLIAVYNGFDEIVQTLLDHNANVDQRNRKGKTPLHVACEENKDKIVALLLLAGANINTTCFRGMVAYQYALNMEVYFLIEKLASVHQYPCEVEKSLTRIENIMKLLRRHIQMMHLLGLPLHEFNKPHWNVTHISTNRSLDLIKRFKREKVYNNLTVDNFFKSLHDPVYVSNILFMKQFQKVVDKLSESDSDLIGVVKYVVRQATKRLEILELGQKWLMYLVSLSDSNLPTLPEEVARRVLHFLRDKEIMRFAKNVKDLKIMSSENTQQRAK